MLKSNLAFCLFDFFSPLPVARANRCPWDLDVGTHPTLHLSQWNYHHCRLTREFSQSLGARAYFSSTPPSATESGVCPVSQGTSSTHLWPSVNFYNRVLPSNWSWRVDSFKSSGCELFFADPFRVPITINTQGLFKKKLFRLCLELGKNDKNKNIFL